MKIVYFFLLGVRECRSDFTTNPGDYIEVYDTGRALGRKILGYED